MRRKDQTGLEPVTIVDSYYYKYDKSNVTLARSTELSKRNPEPVMYQQYKYKVPVYREPLFSNAGNQYG